MPEIIIKSLKPEVQTKDDAVYLTAHDAVTAESASTTSVFVGQSLVDSLYAIYRGCLWFDTAPYLPDNAVIVSATLKVYCTFHDGVSFSVVVVRGVEAIQGNLGDYGRLLLLDETEGRSSVNTNTFAVDDWVDFVLNSAGLAEIVKIGTGYTKFGMRSSKDIRSSVPTGLERVKFDAQDTNLKVRLVIQYTAPSPGYIWASDEAGEETELHYISELGIEKAFEGDDTGNNGDPGYLWVEGTYLHYIDSNGDERRTEGVKEGATGVTSGQFWIESTKLRYIDASGDERRIGGS